MIDPTIIGLVSAATALTASIAGPTVAFRVGRNQVRATVLSANRQKWLDGFRELVASFCSQIAAAVQLRDKVVHDGRVRVSDDPESLRQFERLIFTFTKIRLMVNPGEAEHRDLLAAMMRLLDDIRSAPSSPAFPAHAEAAVTRIVGMTQLILRQEWTRVKKGD